jgi:hypothetical protein
LCVAVEFSEKSSMTKTLLDQWKTHATRRAEFAALLSEPVMLDAIAIVREQIFLPKPIMPGTVDLIAVRALLGATREGYLEMLFNFLSLANISPFRSPDRKSWDTSDREAALKIATEDNGPAPVVGGDLPPPS